MSKKLFLLDAFALIFRAYYALIRNPRITSKGKNTNAQFGFLNTLLDLINNQKPSHMAVCFDTEAPTERHTDFVDYKANRQDAPEDLLLAIPDIKKIVQGFNIPVVGIDGFEADDVIGTLSIQAAKAGFEVYMVTPDKDYGQLVDGNIKIYKPGYQGGDAEVLGAKEVCAKWNIKEVHQVIDILGLMGDAVDNIPGIAGVGEKTAAKLLAEYGTLENVLENADSIKGALGEKVRNGRNAAILSKKLATIITNVPVKFQEEDFKLREWNKEILTQVFTELEFKTIGKRILGDDFSVFQTAPQGVQTDLFGNVVENGKQVGKQAAAEPKEQDTDVLEEERIESGEALPAGKTIHNTPHQYRALTDDAAIKQLIKELLEEKEICFDTETTGIDANDVELVGMSFAFKTGEAYFVPCPGDDIGTKDILKKFEPVFNRKDVLWIGQNLKYDLLVLKWYGYELKGEIFDTMLAHNVIEPEGKHSMDMLSVQFLGYEPVHIDELIGKRGKGQKTMRDVELQKITDYAAEDADITLQLKQIFVPLMKKKEVEKVFSEVDNPLVKVLTDMEFEGVKVDVDFLKEYSKELDREARISEENVYKLAGVKFNLASPKQLGEVLFEKLQLDPKAKKTKTGQYATGEDVLLKLSHNNPIVGDILTFRELTKLKSTYVDAGACGELLQNPQRDHVRGRAFAVARQGGGDEIVRGRRQLLDDVATQTGIVHGHGVRVVAFGVAPIDAIARERQRGAVVVRRGRHPAQSRGSVRRGRAGQLSACSDGSAMVRVPVRCRRRGRRTRRRRNVSAQPAAHPPVAQRQEADCPSREVVAHSLFHSCSSSCLCSDSELAATRRRSS